MSLTKQNLIIGFICLAIGASLSLFKSPQVEIKEVVVYKEAKVVETVTNKDTTTEIREKKNADGSSETVTVITNKDKIKNNEKTTKELTKSLDYSSKFSYNHRVELYMKMDTNFKPVPEASYTYQQGFLFGRVSIDIEKNVVGAIGVKLEM